MGLSRNIARVIVSDTGEISASNLGAVPPTSEVLTPSNTSPANEATDVGETPTLTASTFYSLYGFTHAKSQWQVSTVSDFASTVVSTGDVDDLTSYTVAGGVLSTSTTYYWRVRYKDSNGSYSAWSTATTFTTLSDFDFNVDFLVIAGGGSGGGNRGLGGGGGAGGYIEFTAQSLALGTAYTVTVGAGGVDSGSANGGKGNNSVFSTITSTGGGTGGEAGTTGYDGGSGGGGSYGNPTGLAGGAGNTPSTSPSQGNNGGTGYNGLSPFGMGGGGGAGAVGGNAGGSGEGGNGGAGTSSDITGTSVPRAGGGGGAANTTAGSGGAGGGGAGSVSPSSPTAGTVNTGGGGGGDGRQISGGNGGSGVVIIKYPDSITISNPGGGLTYSTATAGGFSVTTFTVGTGNVSWS